MLYGNCTVNIAFLGTTLYTGQGVSPYNYLMEIKVMLRKPQPVNMMTSFVSVFDKASWIGTLTAGLGFSAAFAVIHFVYVKKLFGLVINSDVPVCDYLIKPFAALVEPDQLLWFKPNTTGNSISWCTIMFTSLHSTIRILSGSLVVICRFHDNLNLCM